MKKIIITLIFIQTLAYGKSEYNKPEEAVTLKRGQTITVSLPSNPTTGYSWSLCSKNTRNTIVGIEELPYQAEQTDLIGSGGTQSWHITGKKRGLAHIKFEYKRPWEKGVAPAKIKRYIFTVS